MHKINILAYSGRFSSYCGLQSAPLKFLVRTEVRSPQQSRTPIPKRGAGRKGWGRGCWARGDRPLAVGGIGLGGDGGCR